MKILYLVALNLFIFFVSLKYGAVVTSALDVFGFDEIIQLRCYRALTAALVGSMLALSGQVLQILLKNPIVDSHILGVSSAGTFGAILSIVVWATPSIWLQSLSAGVAAAGAVCFLLFLRSRFKFGHEILGLPLVGFLMSAFFSALIMLFFAQAQQEQLYQAYAWILGSIHPLESPIQIGILIGFVGLIYLVLYKTIPYLNFTLLGDAFARANGIKVNSVRLISLLSVCSLSATVVVIAGNIGFVGLLVPHFSRRLVGVHNTRSQLLLNLAFGAAMVMLADLMARTVNSPSEMPVGIFTALLGVPVLSVVLWKARL